MEIYVEGSDGAWRVFNWSLVKELEFLAIVDDLIDVKETASARARVENELLYCSNQDKLLLTAIRELHQSNTVEKQIAHFNVEGARFQSESMVSDSPKSSFVLFEWNLLERATADGTDQSDHRRPHPNTCLGRPKRVLGQVLVEESGRHFCGKLLLLFSCRLHHLLSHLLLALQLRLVRVGVVVGLEHDQVGSLGVDDELARSVL